MNSAGRYMPNMLQEISGEITPERMKRWSQSINNTQVWMWLVMEVKSDAVKGNIALQMSQYHEQLTLLIRFYHQLQPYEMQMSLLK